jgi:replication-associated recombination protein RarA
MTIDCHLNSLVMLQQLSYPVDEVSSALQKSIRRGLEEDALYWCAEFYKARPHGIWKRLRVIASEDIGIASPSAALTVRALYENWIANEDEGQLYVVHAVLLLVHAKKSRLVDHATIAAFGPRENGYKTLLAKREVPDYAVDKHTERGRKLGRGFKHFFDDGAQLGNRADTSDPYESRVRAALEEKG